jgi:hypothetical protein
MGEAMKLRKGQAKLFIGGREAEGVTFEDIQIADVPQVEGGDLTWAQDGSTGDPVKDIEAARAAAAGPMLPPVPTLLTPPLPSFQFHLPMTPAIAPTSGMKARIDRLYSRAQIDATFAALAEQFRQLFAGWHATDDAGELRDAFDLALAIHQDDISEDFTIDLEAKREVEAMKAHIDAKLKAAIRDGFVGSTVVSHGGPKIPGVITVEDVAKQVKRTLPSWVDVKAEVDPTDPTHIQIEVKADQESMRRICGRCHYFEPDTLNGGSAGLCHLPGAPLKAHQSIDTCPDFTFRKCAGCAHWTRDATVTPTGMKRTGIMGTCSSRKGATQESDSCDRWIQRIQIQTLGEIARQAKRDG